MPSEESTAESPTAAVPGAIEQALGGAGSSGEAARGLALLVRALGPLTVVTAVLFYYGWTRTNALYRCFGLDTTVLGFTTQDYLLRGVALLLEPVRLLAAGCLVAVWLHFLMSRFLSSQYCLVHPLARRATIFGLLALGLVLWLGSDVTLQVAYSVDFEFLYYPVIWTAGVCITAYACSLAPSRCRVRRGDGELASLAEAIPPAVWRRSRQLVCILLVLGGTKALADYGSFTAEWLARRVLSDPSRQPNVVVYSTTPLGLTATGVTTEVAPSAGQGYLYRYSGLSLLTRSGGKYFLIPTHGSPSEPVVLLLTETDSMRLEFSP